MNAPTTKVQNLMSDYNGAVVNYNSNYIAVASEFNDFIISDDGEEVWIDYVITLHNGMMPAFETRYCEGIQELANGMREIADLRTWSKPTDAE